MSEDFAALACYRHSQIKKRPSLGCDGCAHLSRVVQEREERVRVEYTARLEELSNEVEATEDRVEALTAERDRLRAAVEELRDRAESAFGSTDAAQLHQDVYFMLDVAERALATMEGTTMKSADPLLHECREDCLHRPCYRGCTLPFPHDDVPCRVPTTND